LNNVLDGPNKVPPFHSLSPWGQSQQKKSLRKVKKGQWYTNKDCKHKNLGYLCLNGYGINLVVGCQWGDEGET